MKILIITLASIIMLSTSAFADCKYYAYVDYGPAMLNGELNNKQNVYRSSGLKKFRKGFKAVYTGYDQLQVGEFTMVNIGPYDTEIVAYDALNSFINELKSKGYKKKTINHTMPAIILKNKKECE